ncbi:MAG TPA: DNA repair exonuclease [Candidatus Nanoarchaeia archaeon]|nr:DNA repair exonuclease [Candidatus Nanoarchaeia archaeon]
MKFSHLADCHIGGWKEEKLRELSLDALKKAIDMSIEEVVDFVVISGDLFDSALPPIEMIKEVARQIKRLKDKEINCYVIAGSHDFSLSGKTMLKVFEEAGLVQDLVKFEENRLNFTIDKCGIKLVGMWGKKAGLEIEDYKTLNKEKLEKEDGFKIFVFHTAIDEFKPDPNIKGINCYDLPKGFDYYAGGHVHYVCDINKKDYGRIVYPGALFPNNFKELWDFEGGGFYIVKINGEISLEYKEIKLKEIEKKEIDVNEKSIEQIRNELLAINNLKDKILLLRFKGVLNGKISDLKLNEFQFKNTFLVLKNTSQLKNKEFEKLTIKPEENIEEELISEYSKDIKLKDIILELMIALDKEKEDGEKNVDFEERILKDVRKIFIKDK